MKWDIYSGDSNNKLWAYCSPDRSPQGLLIIKSIVGPDRFREGQNVDKECADVQHKNLKILDTKEHDASGPVL